MLGGLVCVFITGALFGNRVALNCFCMLFPLFFGKGKNLVNRRARFYSHVSISPISTKCGTPGGGTPGRKLASSNDCSSRQVGRACDLVCVSCSQPVVRLRRTLIAACDLSEHLNGT